MSDDRAATARRLIGLIDLTDLADDHAPDGIAGLCERARTHGTAAVCVWPEFVATCAERLAGSGVRVATVVNFPSGDEPVENVTDAVVTALADGADDIDLVLPYRAFLAGDTARAADMIAIVSTLVAPPRIVKVILETGELGDIDTVGAAARLAIDAGADFVKTSTGKTATGASLDAARAMLAEIAATESGTPVGLKPSGGIRTFDEAAAYVELAEDVMGEGWATPATFRFGASGLLDALLAVADGGAGGDGATPDPDSY
jgi:deoxyribose-phosphate aldolase